MTLALTVGEFDLDESVFEIKPERNKRSALEFERLCELAYLFAVHQQSAVTVDFVVEFSTIFTDRYMTVEQPQLVAQNFGKGLTYLYCTGTAAFDLGSGEFDSALEPLDYGVVVLGFAVAHQNRIGIITASGHLFCSVVAAQEIACRLGKAALARLVG